MPTPTEGHSTDTDALVLDRAAHGYWVPGPDAQWRVAGSPTGDGKAFTRAHLASVIAAHHAALYGTEHGDDANADEFQNAGRGQFQTTFHKNLPGEVNRYLEGNPAARHLFHVTQDAAQAGGADALGDLGEDKYFAHVDRLHGSRFSAALDTARNSPDPAMQYAAKVYDNLPETASALRSKATKAEKAGDHERAATLRKRAMDTKEVQTVDAKRLNVGHQFTHNGIVHRVVEDADGHRVLASEHGEFPLEALDAVAVDAGSLRKGKAPKMVPDDIAPFSAAEGDGIWLRFDGSPALELSSTNDKPQPIGWEKGFPVYELWSDALICGDYTHPLTHQKFRITPQVLDQAEQSLSRMLEAGVDCPVVIDHEEKARSSVGWVKGAKRSGNKLRLKHHLIGDDALLLAARNKISVKLRSDFRDSFDRKYPYAITHSSLTPVPVVHGQSGFAIAASAAQPANSATDGVPSVPVFLLSSAPPSERSDNMPVSAELLNRFKSLPGTPEAKDDATAEEILALSLSYAEKAGEHLVTLANEKAVLLSRAETAEASALELSRATPTPADPYAHLDPEALADRADLTLSRIDLAIERGDMSKAIADKIKAKVKGDKPNAMMLSRSDHMDGRPIDFILSLFEGSKSGVRIGEVTATQILARVTPGETVELSGAGALTADANPLLETAKAMSGKK